MIIDMLGYTLDLDSAHARVSRTLSGRHYSESLAAFIDTEELVAPAANGDLPHYLRVTSPTAGALIARAREHGVADSTAARAGVPLLAVPHDSAPPARGLASLPSPDLKRLIARSFGGALQEGRPGGFLVGLDIAAGRAVFVFDGVFDRPAFHLALAEARAHGATGTRLCVHCVIGTYSGAGIDLTRLADVPGAHRYQSRNTCLPAQALNSRSTCYPAQD